jgi:hypothetical protein
MYQLLILKRLTGQYRGPHREKMYRKECGLDRIRPSYLLDCTTQKIYCTKYI